MKVIWNTCERELGDIRSVNTMKTSLKVNLKTSKGNSLYLCKVFRKQYNQKAVYNQIHADIILLSFLQYQFARNQKLVTNIPFTCKQAFD